MSGKSGLSFVFLVMWSLLTLGADGFLVYGIVQDLRAATWPGVPGTILESTVKASRGSKSTTYQFAVRYTYVADGRTYQGTRYRHSTRGSSDDSSAQALAERYAAGSPVTVFHAPGAPGDALLAPGLQGADLFLLLFLLPFNLVMVGLAFTLFRGVKPADDGVGAVQREGRLHVVLNDTPPRLAGVYGTGGAAFLAVFVVGIPTDFEPSLPLALLTWAAVVGAGVYALRWKRARVDSGHYDLVLAPRAQRLTLPAISGRKARLEVRWTEVHDITVELHERKTGKGVNKTYRPTLLLTGEGRFRKEVVVDMSDADRAEALAAWLRAQLMLDQPDAATPLSA